MWSSCTEMWHAFFFQGRLSTFTTWCDTLRKNYTDKVIQICIEKVRDTDLRVVLEVKKLSLAGLRAAQLVASTHLEQHVSWADEVRILLISSKYIYSSGEETCWSLETTRFPCRIMQFSFCWNTQTTMQEEECICSRIATGANGR
jgi:hypothetical protein